MIQRSQSVALIFTFSFWASLSFIVLNLLVQALIRSKYDSPNTYCLQIECHFKVHSCTSHFIGFEKKNSPSSGIPTDHQRKLHSSSRTCFLWRLHVGQLQRNCDTNRCPWLLCYSQTIHFPEKLKGCCSLNSNIFLPLSSLSHLGICHSFILFGNTVKRFSSYAS